MPRRWLALTCVACVSTLVGPALSQEPVTPRPAYLRVRLPDDDAKLIVDGAPTKQLGSNRWFMSPPLEPGKTYSYTFTTTWNSNSYTSKTRSREVSFRAGQEVDVDLRVEDARRPDKILVAYVPTPDEVVEAMLRLGSVGKDDVVYDLGCGDGRLVITAVQQFKAKRGVGVDIDPELVKESTANAKKHGVDDRVEFRRGDVLEIKDLSEATVVMLYVGEDLNMRLRPLLQKTLKPGARIVSHRFLMGDWRPSKSHTVTDAYFSYHIHMWKIGAEGKK